MATDNSPTPLLGSVSHLSIPTEKNNYEEGKVHVEVTRTIEQDLIARNKFSTLRQKHANKIRNQTIGEHWITMDLARQLLSEAQSRRAESEIAPGTVRAYSSLIKNLQRVIQRQEREGLFDDPGYDIAVSRMNSELCGLKIGAPALLADNRRVEISQPYDIYCVTGPEGRFVQKDGTRLAYKPGYVVKEAGGKPFFVSPWCITAIDGQCAYLRAVPARSCEL